MSYATDFAPSVEEAIRIGEHRSMSDAITAMEVAQKFQSEGRVYIPQEDDLFYDYMLMLGAVWASGYIAGVRSERRRRNG